VHNGKVIGIWKRNLKNDSIIFETEYFGSPGFTTKNRVKKSFEVYAQFLGKKTVNMD
jgi:hypothetical protein